MHMVFIDGSWVTSCPQPDPVATSDEEEPVEDGLASPQVNSAAPFSVPTYPQTIDRGAVQWSGGAASRVGAAPSIDLDELRELIDTARRNDEDVHLDPELMAAIVNELDGGWGEE